MMLALSRLTRQFGIERLGRGFNWRMIRLSHRLSLVRAGLLTDFNFYFRRNVRHRLAQTLIVSLTSYPPRFPTLSRTLKCLLSQTIRPDRIILWIASEDENNLPCDVLALRSRGLEIRKTQDIGPFTKIIPALQSFPDAVVVTADDDMHYWRSWLEELISAWSKSSHEIVCHRAHEITLDDAGLPRPYREWNFETTLQGDESTYVFPTGVAGVLYPPSSLSATVLDVGVFTKLCPNNDDIWLYWMGRLAGSRVRNLATRISHTYWRGSQDLSLYQSNVLEGRNDAQIKSMIKTFGWPPEHKDARKAVAP